jgi:hypothetical protein
MLGASENLLVKADSHEKQNSGKYLAQEGDGDLGGSHVVSSDLGGHGWSWGSRVALGVMDGIVGLQIALVAIGS